MDLILGYLPILAVSSLASTPLVKQAVSAREETALMRYGKIAACALGMLLCVAALASQSYNPFIYFRF
jgi:hypothetical protein